ncbi:encapsulating protein for peroxidase [Lentilactobacillus sunkii]|uniref:Encapsulating protein for peroxidase n=1 Tax=Lentilactobacillus sunkii TaxID=481719 RepID=A0A1E7XCA6_9LACO|nr:encapsulin [Lentilactobacillus sunkii]OFA10756.1 encapsulating protein for peroxidase [Lentilactobacillus sunkii]
MAQTAIISKRALENLDRTVYTPKQSQLKARTLFGSYKVPAGTKTYTYRTLTERGAARVLANRGTDIPLVDADMKETSQGIITFALAANYSVQEIQEAQLAGINLDATQGQAISRGMADFEDRLVFTGNPDSNIPGLTNLSTAQNYAFPKSVVGDDPKVILNELKEAREKITQLNGYEDVTPVLALPAGAYDALDVPYNDYQPTTLIELLKNRQWFSQIVKVNELQKADNGKKDMGLIFDNSAETAQILDAEPITRQQTEYRNLTYTIPYSEQCGGLIVRAPQAIVQLKGI